METATKYRNPVRPEGGAHLRCDLPLRTRSMTNPRVPGLRHVRRARVFSQANQEQSLRELFLASHERFVRVAYRILRNNEDAEDAVQDAFLSACRHYRNFEGRSALTTWLTRIVMNAAFMVRRKRKNAESEFPYDSGIGDSTFADAFRDLQSNPELTYSHAESFEIVDGLLSKMHPLLREALSITYYQELSAGQASSVLGVPLSTFKARLFRGRRLLQKRAEDVTRPIDAAATNPKSCQRGKR